MVPGKTLGVCLGLLMLLGACAWAAEGRQALQLAAQVQPRASLSLNRTQITFAGDEDRATTPSREGQVQVTVKVRAGPHRAATLNMRAESDLEGPGGLIPVRQVAWTAQGAGTGNGVLSRDAAQQVSRWTSSGIHQTRLQFVLKKDGYFSPGDYQTFVNFTLSCP